MPQLAVFPAGIAEKRLVRSHLYHRAVIEHRYLVAELAGREPVADIHRGLVPGYGIEFRIYLRLRYRVKRSRRLIKDDKRRILVKRTRNGYLLLFAARKDHSVFLKARY